MNKLDEDEDTYRLDHSWDKGTVQNGMVLRFSNHVVSCIWNRHSIAVAAADIIFKEDIGTR